MSEEDAFPLFLNRAELETLYDKLTQVVDRDYPEMGPEEVIPDTFDELAERFDGDTNRADEYFTLVVIGAKAQEMIEELDAADGGV